MPLTTQYRGSAYEVALPKLPFLKRDSFANIQGIGSLPTARLERKLGDLPLSTLEEVRAAIRFALDIEYRY